MDLQKLIHDYDGRAIVAYDIVPKIQRLLASGYVLRKDGKIAPAITSKAIDAPWIYTRPRHGLQCSMCHEILFGTFGIFPRSCLSCWKVVVRPRTVKELIMLLELEESLTDRPCKCGIEKRQFVPANYGGYFYNQSKEEGLDCLQDVRRLVAEHISPEVSVTLKRYCTEFELRFGPSDQIEQTLMRGYFVCPDRGKVPVMPMGEMQIWEAAARKVIDLESDHTPQPPFVRQHIIRTWFEWAWERGDMTVKEFFGGEPLYTPSVTYES